MLVIISDLHLTDGSSGNGLDAGAFEIFADRLSELARRASWRADGGYRPIHRVDVVLLGDIFDLMHSQRWLASPARPWGDVQSSLVIDMVDAIVGETLRHNRTGLEALRALAEGPAIRLPPAGQSQQPAHTTEEVPVPVRVHYMVGNHDWLFHLPGPRYTAIRRCVADRMGLANDPELPFPHDPYESDEVLGVFRQHRVLARHGDVFDPINYGETRDFASLGDAIVIELVNRFIMQTTQHFAGDLPPALAWGLSELPQIRPLLLIPVWIDGMLDRTGASTDLRRSLKHTWDRLADEFLQLTFVRKHDNWSPFQLIDGLEKALKFSKRMTVGWAAKIVGWLHELRGVDGESYYPHALAEQDFRNRRARHIVYGHTHLAESVPLDASYADGYVLNQLYFNTGTWRRVYRQTRWAPGEREFIPTEALTFAAFYQGDERGGRAFETWTGELAATGRDHPMRRLDAGRTSNAAEQSIPASRVPVRAPHFRRPIPTARSTATPES